jgi:PAS domain S-box-containing protein
MAWLEALSETRELRRCVRDLVALSRLSANWQVFDPHQIANNVAAALVDMIGADFIYVLIPDRLGGPLVEVLRAGEAAAVKSPDIIQAALRNEFPLRADERRLTIPNPGETGALHLACAPIGFGVGAVIVAGSRRVEFPGEAQLLLLETAANEITFASQRWQADADRHRLVSVIERSSSFIGIGTLDGAIQYVNPAGLTLVGLSEVEQSSGLSILDLLVSEDQARARDELFHIVMQEGRWVGDLKFRHVATDAVIPFLADWFRVDDPRTDRPMNMAIVGRDLTAQKRSEAELLSLAQTLEQRVTERTAELAKANQRLVSEIIERERADARLQLLQSEFYHAGRLNAAGQMAAALAHELNQPLTAATNSVNAARRFIARSGPQPDGRISESMSEAVEQMLRAGQIIRRLRDFLSRGEAEKRVEDVVAMIEDASELALTGAETLGIKVRFRFDPNVSHVFADRIQIQQVIFNLMRNAVEAMAVCDRRELEVETSRLGRESVEIAIADSGSGLSHELADRLFDPFVSTKHNSMGLGLSICRSIVRAHGGNLSARPNPHGGTIFFFTLEAATSGGAAHAH